MTYVICSDQESPLGKRTVYCIVIIPRHPDELQPKEKIYNSLDYFFPTPRVDPKAPVLAGRKRSPSEISTESSEGVLNNLTTKEPLEASGESTSDESTISCPDDKNLGPVESELRKEYLAAAEVNQRLLEELSTSPSDILDHGHMVKIISSHRTKHKGSDSWSLLIYLVPVSGVVCKNAPLSIDLVTVPRDGSGKETIAVHLGYLDCIIRALLPSAQVSACESRSKKDSDSEPLMI